jgi:hypothetical protein
MTMPTAEQLADTLRAVVRAFVPVGDAWSHARLVYLADSAGMFGGTPTYGVCGHGHVCLNLAQGWRHPQPHAPAWCDQPPSISHSGIY